MWQNSVDLGNEKKMGLHCILLFQLLRRSEVVQKKKQSLHSYFLSFALVYFLQRTSNSLKSCVYLFH